MIMLNEGWKLLLELFLIFLCYIAYALKNVESGSGKFITWGSTDDEGQSYMTSGKHGVMQ